MSRKIGALWIRKTKEGMQYFSGVLNDLSGDIRIAAFRNDRKEKENQPDFNIVLSEQKQPTDGIAPTQPQQARGLGEPIILDDPPEAPPPEEIPF